MNKLQMYHNLCIFAYYVCESTIVCAPLLSMNMRIIQCTIGYQRCTLSISLCPGFPQLTMPCFIDFYGPFVCSRWCVLAWANHMLPWCGILLDIRYMYVPTVRHYYCYHTHKSLQWSLWSMCSCFAHLNCGAYGGNLHEADADKPLDH